MMRSPEMLETAQINGSNTAQQRNDEALAFQDALSSAVLESVVFDEIASEDDFEKSLQD
jgi:hypothetical protein